MAVEIITREDLFAFKSELLNDLKNLLSSDLPKPKKWLRTKEVISMFNISAGTLKNYRHNRKIPFTRIGKIIYYPLDDIQNILEVNQ